MEKALHLGERHRSIQRTGRFPHLRGILSHQRGELLFIELWHQADPNASDGSVLGNRMPKGPLLQKVAHQIFRVGAGLCQRRLRAARRTDRNRQRSGVVVAKGHVLMKHHIVNS